MIEKAVKSFLVKFGVLKKPVSAELLNDRMNLVKEEFFELMKAYKESNAEEIVDAVKDLQWVLEAFLQVAQVDSSKALEEITKANMSKEVGDKVGRTTLCGDIRKPEGWVGPDHSDNHGLLHLVAPVGDFTPLDALIEAHLLKIEKSKDYQGSRYSQEDYFPHGMYSYHTLLTTKVNRIGSVMEQDPVKINHESMRDSVIDLINYSAMTSSHLVNKERKLNGTD